MTSKMRILIADNDLESLSKLYLKLLHRRIKTEATNSADEIIARIQRFKPHLLLLNPSMIDEPANAFCKKLKTDYRVISILLIESSDQFNYQFDTITKPIDVDVLLDVIDLYRY
ncbi:MAG TPA: hypothetical protein VNS32_02870 [Flavisolibacter sp.]|nr:hypothetical protein [Flavisolibacter sp.]